MQKYILYRGPESAQLFAVIKTITIVFAFFFFGELGFAVAVASGARVSASLSISTKGAASASASSTGTSSPVSTTGAGAGAGVASIPSKPASTFSAALNFLESSTCSAVKAVALDSNAPILLARVLFAFCLFSCAAVMEASSFCSMSRSFFSAARSWKPRLTFRYLVRVASTAAAASASDG